MIPLFARTGKKHRWPLVTWLLVVINVTVFVYELSLSPAQLECVFHDYGAIPYYLALHMAQPSLQEPACALYDVPNPLLMTMISALFLHVGWLHLAGNMLFLLIFGAAVEDRLGHPGFAGVYLACGLAGMVAQTAVDPQATIPIVGASGAVAGVLAGYLVLFPGVRVRTFFFVLLLDLPAWLVIGLWIVAQALSGLAVFDPDAQAAGGVAYVAHLGGFATGLVLILLYRWFAPAPAAPPSAPGAAKSPRSEQAP
jgi:membrane associated rhomboid family serine protease